MLAVAVMAAPHMAGAADHADPNAAANALFDRQFQQYIESEPAIAASLGLRIRYGEWTDPTERGDRLRMQLAREQLAELVSSVKPEALDEPTRLSFEVAKATLERRLARHPWRNHDYMFDKGGPHVSLPSFLLNTHRIDNAADAEAWVQRLEGIGNYLRVRLERAEEARRAGVLPPRFVFPYVVTDAQNIITGRPFDEGPADSPLFADAKARIGALDIDPARREALLARAELALLESVGPAYQEVIAWATATEPLATSDDGVWKLPQGQAYYDYLLAHHTTTALRADEIHAIGLREVGQLQDDMRRLMPQLGFEGSLAGLFEHMRSDDRFYYPGTLEGRAAYLAEATRIIDTMWLRLPELFVTVPKARVVVRAVEPFREKSAGKAFYQRPPADGSRPGVFYVNLYDMREVPKYEIEALAYHEGVPGHHMQAAFLVEREALPRFRRTGGFTAYGEGWGLYTERLPVEIGLYSDPWSEMGRLVLEIHRAVRLVVDTGIHAKRWTREQAIAYQVANTPVTEEAAARAIERYILNPGQATAYTIGMLKIIELRERAEAALGERFDLRHFHELVLGTGGVPLTVLEAEVLRWIDTRRAEGDAR